MKKKLLLLMMVSVLLITAIPAFAAEEPVIFKDRITVTEDGGRYQIGFVDVDFKKNFIDSDMLPITFDVEIYAEDGKAYVEFNPDTPNFLKPVHIRVDNYKGFLYDKAEGKNIKVKIKKHHILAKHFSRYCLD